MSASDDQGEKECPLCMEQLDLDELNFFPCKCGYQICQFCWNRIKEEENGLCPACRQPYPEQPADFKPLSADELKKIQLERRKREQQRKQKMSENRKHLANLRVVQRNLVLVHGLPLRLADAEILKRLEYFGQFGKIFKIVIGTNNLTNNATPTVPLNASVVQVAAASVYVTYNKEEDAVKAILALNQKQLDGRILRASLGTTKYCSSFLQNKPCQKTDCMYLHEVGDSEASFTKDDMAAKKHEEYERKVCDQIMTRINLNRPTNSPPPLLRDVFPSTCNDNNVVAVRCRDGSVPPPSTTSVQQELSQSPTPTSRHNHTRSNPPPRHRRPHSQMQLNESKCTTNSVDSVVDQLQSGQRQSPEPLQRSSTLDNSCFIPTSANCTLSPSVSARLQNGFGSSSNFPSSENNSLSAVNIVDQNDSPSVSLSSPVSPSSLPTATAAGGFLQQKPLALQQHQLANSLNAKIQPSLANWQNSRILAAIQHQQNQSNSHSLFSHDDDAFYRPKLKQLQILQHQDNNRSTAECSGTNKLSPLESTPLLTNGLMNGGLDHHDIGHSGHHHHHSLKPTDERIHGDGAKSSTHEDLFVLSGDNLNVRSHTDWQAAFGFGKTDDDLGFDPFSESSKALEDLVREEKEQQQRRDQINHHHQFHQQQQIHQHHQHQIRQQQKSHQPQLQNMWPVQSQHNLHYGASGHPFGNDASHSHHGLVSPSLFRPNTTNDLPQKHMYNGALPNYNGLNAQAAPFVPRQIIPPQQQRDLNIKDMQEQFKALFPDASVKFAPHISAPPPNVPSAAGMMPPNSRSAGWPHRIPDPRQAMFSRPPPPLATNGPICFPRPPMKPSPTGSDMSFHHHHPRITGPPGSQFPPGPNTPVFSDFPGWSGLAPTPPPGFAPTHQNSS